MQAGILKNALHAIIADRGPLWLDGYGSIDHFQAFMAEYNRQFPARFGRKRRFIPEREASPRIDNIMQANGFKKTNAPGYQTIQLDLTDNQETLRANLRKSWRQSLNKAEKSGLEVEWNDTGSMLPWMLKYYQLDKQKRGYDGPDVKTMQALGQGFAAEKKLLIGMATLDKKAVAAILILIHGRAATYQIGWSTEGGRATCAHHFLLWRALGELQNRNIHDLDLGGVNDDTAKSIKTFKSGMGGSLIQLAGLYT